MQAKLESNQTKSLIPIFFGTPCIMWTVGESCKVGLLAVTADLFSRWSSQQIRGLVDWLVTAGQVGGSDNGAAPGGWGRHH